MPQYGLLLCLKHYRIYIQSEKTKLIMINLMHDAFCRLTIKSSIRLLYYNFLHYSQIRRVLYVEHFPLETLFHHWFVYGRFLKNKKISPHQFIKDFDYDDNIKIGLLKNHFNTADANEKIINFASSKFGLRSRLGYSGALIVSTANIIGIYYIIGWHLLTKVFVSITAVAIILIPVIHLGIKVVNELKVIYRTALDNKLYIAKTDNESFIRASKPIINRIIWNNERYLTLLGCVIVFPLYILKELWFTVSGHLPHLLLIVTGITTIIFIAIFTYLVYVMFFLNTSILRFKNYPLRLDFLLLDKSAGLNHIRKFWQTYSLYNVIIAVSIVALARVFRDPNNTLLMIAVVFISFVFGGSFSSIPLIIRLYSRVKAQFKNGRSNLLEKLNKSRDIKNIDAYNLILETKFGFVNFSTSVRWVAATIPYFIAIMSNYYVKEINNFIQKALEHLF